MSALEIAALIQDISAKFQFYTSIVILFIGIIGNILIILIFTSLKIFRDNRSAYYLVVESVTDIGFLLSVLPYNIILYVLKGNPVLLSIVWCKLRLMISYSCGLSSLYTICFLALDQYLSTNHRPTWRQKSTLQLAHRLTLCSLILAIIHGILLGIFADIGSTGCSIYQHIMKIYFTFFFYPILSSILPLFISILLGFLAYHNVRRIIRRQISLERRRLDQQMTAIALVRVITITILGLPFIILRLIQLNVNYKDDHYIMNAILNVLVDAGDLLLYTNFCIHFYVFLIISSRFRRQVKSFFVKKCYRPLIRFYCRRLKQLRNNQVIPDATGRHRSSVETS